jgi:hypothetical protein
VGLEIAFGWWDNNFTGILMSEPLLFDIGFAFAVGFSHRFYDREVG